MIKLKELGISQVILYEYLKDNLKTIDELDDMLIDGMDYYFDSFKEASERVKRVWDKIESKQEVEVIYLIAQYLLKKGDK